MPNGVSRAVARDPKSALACDSLAEFYHYLGFVGFVSPMEALAKGVFHALRVLEIDDTLAETHALVALSRLDYDWTEVRRELDRHRRDGTAARGVSRRLRSLSLG